MRNEDRIRLVHMNEYAETALRFAAGRTRADLDSDEMLLFALLRAIEIVGEAASNVSEATRREHPDIPWKLIVSMRNRLVHAYFHTNRDIVWSTVTDELPALLPVLRAALPSQ